MSHTRNISPKVSDAEFLACVNDIRKLIGLNPCNGPPASVRSVASLRPPFPLFTGKYMVFWSRYSNYIEQCALKAGRNVWDASKSAVNARETYRALLCKSLAVEPRDCALPPELNAVWREMILETEQYSEFCTHVIGSFLHHGGEAPDAPESRQARVDQTRAIYRQVFHAMPNWVYETHARIVTIPAPRRSKRLKTKNPMGPVVKDTCRREEYTVQPQHFVLFLEDDAQRMTWAYVVSPTMNVSTVMRMHWREHPEHPVHAQRLMFNGQPLRPECTLQREGIVDEHMRITFQNTCF